MNFDRRTKNELQHHSVKKPPKMNQSAKFGNEML